MILTVVLFRIAEDTFAAGPLTALTLPALTCGTRYTLHLGLMAGVTRFPDLSLKRRVDEDHRGHIIFQGQRREVSLAYVKEQNIQDFWPSRASIFEVVAGFMW